MTYHSILKMLCLLAGGLLSAAGLQAQEFQVGDLTYSVTSGTNRTCEITKCDAAATAVTIPATVDYGGTTYTVAKAGDTAFKGCTALTSLTIADSPEVLELGSSIGPASRSMGVYYGEFQDCPITELYIGRNLHFHIYEPMTSPFGGSKVLNSLTIGSQVTKLQERLFTGCQVESVVIPGTVDTVEASAFSVLRFVTIGQSDKSLNVASRSFGTALENAVIDRNISYRYAEDNPFRGQGSLTYVTVGGNMTTVNDYCFADCERLEGLSLSDGVRKIGRYAFVNCPIGGTIIPHTVDSIGSGAFASTNALTIAESPDASPKMLCFYYDQNYSYDGNDIIYRLESVYLGRNVECKDYRGFYSSPFPSTLKNVYMGFPVTKISDCLFRGCSALDSVGFNSRIDTIGENAFQGCTALKRAVLPYSLKAIGRYAFAESGLDTIALNYGLTSIGENAFRGTRLHTLTIPSTVTSVEREAFNAPQLKTLVLENGSEPLRIGYNAVGDALENLSLARNLRYNTGYSPFSELPSLKRVVVTGDITKLEDELFYRCKALDSVSFYVHADIDTIGEYTFGECTALRSVSIHGSTVAVEPNAFRGCTSLKNVRIEDGFSSEDSLYILHAFIDCPVETLYIGRNLYDYNTPSSSYALLSDGKHLTSVIFGEGVTAIKGNTFSNCSALRTISLPERLKTIGNYAFSSCTALESVDIPNGVSKIGEGAFNGCTSLASATLPSGLKRIEDFLFLNCSSLEAIQIPEATEQIGWRSFSGCTSLTNLRIPRNVKALDSNTFEGCTGLTELVIEDSPDSLNIGYTLYQGSTGSFNDYRGAFRECPLDSIYLGRNYFDEYDGHRAAPFSGISTLKAVEFGPYVTEVRTSAFDYCTALSSVRLNEGIVSIGEDAFWGCDALVSIRLPQTVEHIGKNAFTQCASLADINIPGRVSDIGQYAFYYCESLPSVRIPASLQNIGRRAFEGCAALKEVIVEDGTDSLKWECDEQPALTGCPVEYVYLGRNLGTNDYYTPFSGLDSLKTLVVGRTVTSIRDNCFNSCGALASATLPEGLKNIGIYAFSGCYALSDAKLPASLESIGQSAFYRCGLKSLVIPDKVATIGESAFWGCDSLVSVSLGTGITEINDGLFSGCSSLRGIDIPENVAAVGNSAFSECKSLTYVRFPDNLEGIGNYAFDGCDMLTEIRIPGSVKTLGHGAFEYCDRLASIELEDGVEELGYGAFQGCESLAEIDLPNSIRSIGEEAFDDCSMLRTIHLGNNVASIGEQAFGDCISLTRITLPASLTSIERYAFEGCSLAEIYALGTVPPTIDAETFDAIHYINTRLYVPRNSAGTYRLTPYWQNFQHMEETEFTGLEATKQIPGFRSP